jgi:hypothetical protein
VKFADNSNIGLGSAQANIIEIGSGIALENAMKSDASIIMKRFNPAKLLLECRGQLRGNN